MRRLVWAFAGRTYHIVGNLMPWLNYIQRLSDIDKIATSTAIWKEQIWTQKWGID